jgi:hypothetical protein
MNQPSGSKRTHSPIRSLLSVGLALLVVGSLTGHAVGTSAAVGSPVAGSPAADAAALPDADVLDSPDTAALDATTPRDSPDIAAQRNPADIDVDCNESVVRVTAPSDFSYTLRVSTVLVAPTGTEVFTTTATQSGNATVSLSERGPVYAFAFSGTGLVASAFENCAADDRRRGPDATTGPETTTGPPGPGVPTADVDCDAGEVRVVAPSDFSYTLRVSTLFVTPSSTEVFTTARTVSGNATVAVENADGVAVSVSNETGAVASAFENCRFDG